VTGPPREPGEGAITVTLLAASALTVMAGATIAPGLPAIHQHFAATPTAELLTKMVLTVPALSIAVFSSIIGWVIDRAGRKIVLVSAIILYAVAGTSVLYLDDLYAILAGRALQGIAVAGTMTASITLIGDYFHGADRNRVIGLQGAALNVAGIVFVGLGGLLAEIHWRAPFAVFAASLLLIPAVQKSIREPARSGAAADVSSQARDSVRGVLKLLVFLYAVSLLIQIAFYMTPVQLPFFLEKIGVSSPSLVGLAIAMMTVCSATTAALFKWIRARIDNVAILGASLLGMGIGYLIISTAESFAHAVIGVMIFGLGLGLTFTNIIAWLMERTPAGIRGRAVGGLATFAFLGQFLSPVAALPLIEHSGLAGMYRTVGFALLAGSVVAIAAFSAKRVSRAG
jgi:MFS family permease